MKLRQTLTYEPVALGFGTSGLRGLLTDMTDLECYINAKGFIDFARQDNPSATKVYLAGDLRDSTPRIMRVVAQAIIDSGLQYENCGLIPTPALAYYAQQHDQPGIVVTGSHIPANRNGIKFYKSAGEVLKMDEAAIHEAVDRVRSAEYDNETSLFNAQGEHTRLLELEPVNMTATESYKQRYTKAFDQRPLADKHIVMYQHSAVGRDLIPEILEMLGAKVTRVGKSDVFVPIDTENVGPKEEAYFQSLAAQYPDNFAIISTDGDSDRPFLIDETGVFHRGDVLGLPTTDLLGIRGVAMPVSANDAVIQYCQEKGIACQTTKIGSPHVILAMQHLQSQTNEVAGWEVNGGYLLGSAITMPNGALLQALPTRDALLPIIGALVQALSTNQSISALFASYPRRFTQAGLIDNFPTAASQKILEELKDLERAQEIIGQVASPANRLINLVSIDATDGIRMRFKNDDVLHIRPSGNAPQLRAYSNAASQSRADEIVAMSVREPDGILRRLQQRLT
jgi:phosphomannomutase